MISLILTPRGMSMINIDAYIVLFCLLQILLSTKYDDRFYLVTQIIISHLIFSLAITHAYLFFLESVNAEDRLSGK